MKLYINNVYKMSNPGNYPSPVFDCPPQAPVLKPSTFQWNSSSEPSTFQAARDWSWSEPQAYFPPPQPPGPWNWNPNPHGNWHGGPWHQNYGPNRHRGGQHHGRQDFGGKKKNKREPEFSFFCDTCDRGFKDQDKYDEHLSQHVKCTVADCSFTAHEKLVKIHWRNSHAPGTKRIKLDTAEDIAKWREERRRNYPTLANVEKKMKVMEAKEERGEVLETAQFGRMKGRGRGRGRGGHRRGGFRGRGWGRDSSFHSNPKGGSEENQQQQQPPPVSQPPKEVDPLGALANSDPDSDREVSGEMEAVSVAPKSVSSGLASLVASYGGMTDSESDQEPEAAPILKATKALEENKAMLQTPPAGPPQPRAAPWGSSVPMVRASPGSIPPRGRGRGRGRGRRRGRGARHQGGDTPHPRRHTLLEMLLAPDIRHERNVLLQCVRFIVRNSFFGLEKSGDEGDVTARQQGDNSGADVRSQSQGVASGSGINGSTQDSSRTSSQSKDTPQNDSPGREHQPGRSNPGVADTGNGDETEGSVTQTREERPVSERPRSRASEGASDTHPTPWVYEDDVWEMDGVDTTDENAQGSGYTARQACDSGMVSSGGMGAEQCSPLEEKGAGIANGLREMAVEMAEAPQLSTVGTLGSAPQPPLWVAPHLGQSGQSEDVVPTQGVFVTPEPAPMEGNLNMDAQPASSVYDDDVWEMPSGNADEM
ncbi:hypothetical protein ACEWY4_016995 [Coilia grayii]|uniref:C2H2-type domain-containing protein n=1 Tax=Coilia grayii TaxID=363190 RepID=A0ABD1JM62_9TELE